MRKPGVVAVGCCGLVLSGSSAIWISRHHGVRPPVQPQPTLLDRVHQVASTRPTFVKDPLRSPRPSAPRLTSWRSPLTKQCSQQDQTVRQRLVVLREQLHNQREVVSIDASNYGKRYHLDPWQQTINPTPRLVVLHETANSLSSAINTFQTYHPNDHDQVSYHTLIARSGKVIDVVDPLLRAYGAGYSAFRGEWAVTNPDLMGSVNNFALHLSLETPRDGYLGGQTHSGYTSQQYDALAVVLDDWITRFHIAPEAITTHEHVDLGGMRGDPRSFRWSELQVRMAALNHLC
ncbi:MAG: N-acetylmuramoyl-L-alanine amidase [Synechococcus sp.]